MFNGAVGEPVHDVACGFEATRFPFSFVKLALATEMAGAINFNHDLEREQNVDAERYASPIRNVGHGYELLALVGNMLLTEQVVEAKLGLGFVWHEALI